MRYLLLVLLVLMVTMLSNCSDETAWNMITWYPGGRGHAQEELIKRLEQSETAKRTGAEQKKIGAAKRTEAGSGWVQYELACALAPDCKPKETSPPLAEAFFGRAEQPPLTEVEIRAAQERDAPRPALPKDDRPDTYVTVDSTDVRAGPAESEDRIAILSRGTPVRVQEKSEDGRWYRIEVTEGLIGFVTARQLRPNGT